MLYAEALAVLPPMEAAGLFAIWNWSRRGRTILWLLIGLALIGVASFCGALSSPSGGTWLLFTGIYLATGLAWAWSVEALAPSQWRFGEWFVAGVAVAALGASILWP